MENPQSRRLAVSLVGCCCSSFPCLCPPTHPRFLLTHSPHHLSRLRLLTLTGTPAFLPLLLSHPTTFPILLSLCALFSRGAMSSGWWWVEITIRLGTPSDRCATNSLRLCHTTAGSSDETEAVHRGAISTNEALKGQADSCRWGMCREGSAQRWFDRRGVDAHGWSAGMEQTGQMGRELLSRVPIADCSAQ